MSACISAKATSTPAACSTRTLRPALPVYDITPFTMLDFPGKTACIIWFAGCNMRCAYCHNPQIVRSTGRESINDILSFLEKRRGFLDGVVLSGGEVTTYPGLVDLITKIRTFGYAIKVDTNGLRPEKIRELLDKCLVDYLALDYKAPPEKFKKVTGVEKFNAFAETLDLLCSQKNIPFEVRTTVHTSLLDENDIGLIVKDLDQRGFRGEFYVQNFRNDNRQPTLRSLPSQARALDIQALPHAHNFTIGFRNF